MLHKKEITCVTCKIDYKCIKLLLVYKKYEGMPAVECLHMYKNLIQK